MITYVYETIPKNPDDIVERFEWRQRISDPALERHPKTGVPVRRVISGGLGFASSGGESSSGSCCKGSCGCN
ncbi:MAG: zinc ribbon domain-containing protein [Verrucomicrobiota bacterium]